MRRNRVDAGRDTTERSGSDVGTVLRPEELEQTLTTGSTVLETLLGAGRTALRSTKVERFWESER